MTTLFTDHPSSRMKLINQSTFLVIHYHGVFLKLFFKWIKKKKRNTGHLPDRAERGWIEQRNRNGCDENAKDFRTNTWIVSMKTRASVEKNGMKSRRNFSSEYATRMTNR